MYLFVFSCSEVDSLTVNINVNGEPTDLGLYCGSKLPPMLMSNEPHMSVIFNTIKGGARQGARGFNASFSFVTGKRQPLLITKNFYENF